MCAVPNSGVQERYTVNDLTALSAKLNTLQLRLVALLRIYRYIDWNPGVEGLYKWSIDPKTMFVYYDDSVRVSEEMAQTLRVIDNTSHEGDSVNYTIEELTRLQLLAVVAYMVCFGSNPYLGSAFFREVLISREWENNYFGENRKFAFDSGADNTPDGYYQSRTIERWNSLINRKMRDAMSQYFESRNIDVAQHLPRVAYEMLSSLSTASSGERIVLIDRENDVEYQLTDGKILMNVEFDIIGETRLLTENGRTDLYLENKSAIDWQITTASGKKLRINPGKSMPVRSGMIIDTGINVWEAARC